MSAEFVNGTVMLGHKQSGKKFRRLVVFLVRRYQALWQRKCMGHHTNVRVPSRKCILEQQIYQPKRTKQRPRSLSLSREAISSRPFLTNFRVHNSSWHNTTAEFENQWYIMRRRLQWSVTKSGFQSWTSQHREVFAGTRQISRLEHVWDAKHKVKGATVHFTVFAVQKCSVHGTEPDWHCFMTSVCANCVLLLPLCLRVDCSS